MIDPDRVDHPLVDVPVARRQHDTLVAVLGFEKPVAKRHPASRCRAGGVLFGVECLFESDSHRSADALQVGVRERIHRCLPFPPMSG